MAHDPLPATAVPSASTSASAGASGTSEMVRSATSESRLARYGLIVLSLAFVGLFLVMPLAIVFTEALRKGPGLSWKRWATPRPGRPSG